MLAFGDGRDSTNAREFSNDTITHKLITDHSIGSDDNDPNGILHSPVDAGNGSSGYQSSIGQYRDAINDLESINGPYSSQISEELTGLGLVYQEREDHEKAISSFERALHLTRVNEGLHSMNQVVLVEYLIESYIALERWERTKELHYYLFRLNRYNYGIQSPKLLPIINRLSHSYLQAFNDNKSHPSHLVYSHELTLLSINIIENIYGKYDRHLIAALKGLTTSNYYFHTYFGQELASQNDFNIAMRGSVDESYARLMYYTKNSADNGTDTISRIVDLYEHDDDTDPMIKAKARILIADWEMIVGRRQSATAMYKEIYQDLWNDEAIRIELAASLAEATPLPDQSLFSDNDAKTISTLSENYVLVQFDVSASGKLENVEILESNPGGQALGYEVQQKLREVKFRPRMAEGTLVSSERVIHRLDFD